MIGDARRISPGASVEAQVCVIGAGPLGIAVTRSLLRAGLSVVQLESGSEGYDPTANALGDVGAIRFGGVRGLGNTRQVGGNSNAWQVRTGTTRRGVRLVPMTAADFEGHSGMPGSAWPFGIDTLTPYAARAQQFFGLPDAGYEAEAWLTPRQGGQALEHPDVRSLVFQFANGHDLVTRSARALRENPGVQLFTSATALEILTNVDASRAVGVRVASAPGREFHVRAQHVILAAGTATTTQLLLASDAVHPAGLGNSGGVLGRNFMDHLLLRGGIFRPRERTMLDQRDFYDIHTVGDVPVMGHLQLTDEAIRRGGLLNLSFVMLPRTDSERDQWSSRQITGQRAALAARESLIRRRMPSGRVLADLARGFDGVAGRQIQSLRQPVSSLGRGGWSRLRGPASERYTHFEVMHQAEQAPHPDNRMFLVDERDALGARKLGVESTWHAEDADATVRAQETFARALSESGWGEFEIASTGDRPVVHSHSSNHFMGTTRMSTSPESGVVDAHGAVHGTPNLFVASSSVFPSGGFANVTLTALALSLRTADAVIARSHA